MDAEFLRTTPVFEFLGMKIRSQPFPQNRSQALWNIIALAEEFITQYLELIEACCGRFPLSSIQHFQDDYSDIVVSADKKLSMLLRANEDFMLRVNNSIPPNYLPFFPVMIIKKEMEPNDLSTKEQDNRMVTSQDPQQQQSQQQQPQPTDQQPDPPQQTSNNVDEAFNAKLEPGIATQQNNDDSAQDMKSPPITETIAHENGRTIAVQTEDLKFIPNFDQFFTMETMGIDDEASSDSEEDSEEGETSHAKRDNDWIPPAPQVEMKEPQGEFPFWNDDVKQELMPIGHADPMLQELLGDDDGYRPLRKKKKRKKDRLRAPRTFIPTPKPTYDEQNERPYSCESCGVTFIHLKNYQRHYKTAHMGIKLKKYKSPNIKDEPGLEIPKPNVVPDMERPYACTGCESSFIHLKNYQRHYKTVHLGIREKYKLKEAADPNSIPNDLEGDRPYGCKLCEATFIHLKNFTRHYKSQHGKGDKFQCQLCGKTLLERKNLKSHIESVHEGKRPHQCQICTKSFTQRSGLNRHIAVVHERRKLSQCDTCGKVLMDKGKLKIHYERAHQGIKPNQCDVCGKSYYLKSELSAHFQSSHEKIRRHQCTVCGKAFVLKNNLRSHQVKVHKFK